MHKSLAWIRATTYPRSPEYAVTEPTALRQSIDQATVAILRWGQKLPVGFRSLAGLLLMLGGVFGFLPILGFWMFPLGLALIALDIPWTRSRMQAWIDRIEKRIRSTASQHRANNR